MSNGYRSIDLPFADGPMVELIGHAEVLGGGPLATRKIGLAALQAQLLGGTSAIGARFVGLENRVSATEGLSNQVPGIDTRLKAVEALGGIGSGTDLVADATAVRATRYWPRPGEAPRTWTSATAAPPQTATPIALTGVYSVYSDGPVRGPALRITGVGYATSIAKTHLDDGEVVEFTFRLARRIDNTGSNAAANNVPVLEFRCYKADLTDNGTVGLPTTALVVADGLRTVAYRACLTPGVGSVELPANTRFISPLFGERGNGAIELVSCDRGTQPLSSAPVVTTIADADFVPTISADRKTTSLITVAAFATLMEARLVEKFIPGIADTTVGTAPFVLIPADPDRNNVQIINTSATEALLIGFGATPIEGAKHTILLPPSGGYEQRYPRTDAIYAMAKSGNVPVFANYTNRSGLDVVGDGLVLAYLARGSGNATPAHRAVISDFFKETRKAGVFAKFRTAALLANIDSDTAYQDLVHERAWSRFNAPTFTRYKGPSGDGVSQYIDSNYSLLTDNRLSATSHAFGMFADDKTQGTNAQGMGNSVIALAPNRTTVAAGSRSASGARADVTTVGGKGGLFQVSRSSADGYRFGWKQTLQSVASASTGFGSIDNTVTILAVAGTQGATAFSTHQVGFAYVAEPLTDKEMLDLETAVAKYVAAMAAFGA